MSRELNNLLKQAYNRYKDVENPPVPLKEIKDYLELEGMKIDVKNKQEIFND